MNEMQIDTRSFVEIYESLKVDRVLHLQFNNNLKNLSQAAVRSYGTGRRKPLAPSLPWLIQALKKTGIDVGDGRYLFAK